ncbi:OPT oligopeptide transporter protein-domain-containing protein [Cerioporus squamosus]|nr:OPT oligopeptide transporter protein-domain-containing protein [Cerioporus squamosus]
MSSLIYESEPAAHGLTRDESSHGSTDEKHFISTSRPFPVDPNEIEETHQLTLRAIVVGCVLGAVVGASNIYLGLKTGFTFGPQGPPESGLLGRLLGGPFGPKENCTVQSAATAAGGIGILFVSAIPAMYRLDLMSTLPKQDIGKLIALTACAGSSARTGAVAARKKSLALLGAFVIVFVYKVMTGYAPGILYDWHIGWTLYRLGFTSIISLDNYGWWIEFTPAFFGAGMLSGLNASWSFFGGSILAWGIIAPSLVKNGLAFVSLITYQALSFDDPALYTTAPSPRYWLLWPGILMMLLYSFADLAMNSGSIYRNIKNAGINLNPVSWFRDDPNYNVDEDEDLSPREDRVPTLWWTVGLAASVIMCCAILATMFAMNVGEAILSLVLGFVFSFIGVQSAGTTDVNPVSTVAKASQLIFGGIGKGAGMAEGPAQIMNLTAGVIAAGSAAQSTDMTGDLKTGYLLRAKPRNQFVAQLCGACRRHLPQRRPLHPLHDRQPVYPAPSCYWNVHVRRTLRVRMGRRRRRGVCAKAPHPASSGYTSIALGVFAVISVVKYWVWVPNWNAVGLAFVVPQVYYSIAMAAGSIFNYVWMLRNPASFDMYMFAVAAGMLAGEGLGGVLQALLAVAKVDGSLFGTSIGCPGFEFCG